MVNEALSLQGKSLDRQTATLCKAFLTLLNNLKNEVGEEALYDENGVRYVEQDFDFSHLETTWPKAMNKFHTPVGQRVIETMSMGHNPVENDLKELNNGDDAKDL